MLGKIITAIFVLVIVCVIGGTLLGTMVIAEDTSEGGIVGVDMAATWDLDGFNYIYPGSSIHPNGGTLHNIHMFSNGLGYDNIPAIMENTYHKHPHILLVVDDTAANWIFGEELMQEERNLNWGQNMDRGDALNQAMANNMPNFFMVLPAFLTGHISVHFI